MAGLPPKKPEPARGALAGIKADLERAKATGQAYDPRGVGNAFTHNFLNQKPWHPLNFRNQIRKYEAEQRAVADEKAREQGQAEFEAEQETMRTMSYLSEEEQRKYKERWSISFMYMKPPGLDAALQKEKLEEEATKAKALQAAASTSGAATPGAAAAQLANPGSAPGGGKGRPQLTPAQQEEMAARARDLDRVREDPVATLLAARAALQHNDRFILKGGAGTHGGFGATAANQQLLEDDGGPDPGGAGSAPGPGAQQVLPGVVADADDLAVLASMSDAERAEVLRHLAKAQRRAERQQRIEEAQAVLRAAGYDVEALAAAAAAGGARGGSEKRSKWKGGKHRHKPKRGDKEKRKAKESKRRRGEKGGTSAGGGNRSSSSSSSGESDSGTSSGSG